jgi:hypothetical protein
MGLQTQPTRDDNQPGSRRSRSRRGATPRPEAACESRRTRPQPELSNDLPVPGAPLEDSRFPAGDPGLVGVCSRELAGAGDAGVAGRVICGACTGGAWIVGRGAGVATLATGPARAGRLVLAATPISSWEALLRRTGIAAPPTAAEMPGSGASRGGLPGLVARPIAKKHAKITPHRHIAMTSPRPSMPMARLSAWIQRLAVRTVLTTRGMRSA